MSDIAKIAAGAALCLALAGCNPVSACIDGELYTDVNQDGVLVGETDIRGRPIKCAVRAHIQENENAGS